MHMDGDVIDALGWSTLSEKALLPKTACSGHGLDELDVAGG